jgi:hypothetical protein
MAKRNFFLLVLLAMLVLSPVFASIKDICPDKNGRQDDFCISQNAADIADCRLIAQSPVTRDSCYKRLARTASDCSEIPSLEARSDCVVYKHYEAHKGNMGSCSQIEPMYEKECYLFFASQDSPGDPDACDPLPPGYIKECQKQAIRYNLGFSPKEEYCNTISPKYHDVCIETVNQQKDFLAMAFAIIGGLVAAIAAFALLPFCCIGIVLIAIVVAVYMYATRKK